jgi:hypothetical protein
MQILKKQRPWAALAVALVLGGCASTRPVPYSGLSSSQQLRANPEDKSGRVPYQYSSEVNWRQYASVMVDRVEVYGGIDHQFEDISPQDREALARYMELHFREALRGRFAVVNSPTSSTLRVKVTLTGAKSNTRVLSTFTRFDIGGGPYNMMQAARGEEGAFTGSVSYAVEIFDASTNRLLKAYVAKQFPNAWNIKATLGSLDASKVGIEKGAEDLVARLN